MKTQYDCVRCGFTSKIRKNYLSHLEKKKICKPVLSNANRTVLQEELKNYISNGSKGGIQQTRESETCEMPKNICINCNKFFSTRSNLIRHTNLWCKKKNLFEEVEHLKKSGNITINNNTNSYNEIHNNKTFNNNITNNIYVYGSENVQYVTSEVLKKVHINPYENISNLVGLIHYNAKHPENQNVKWVNINKPYIQRYEKNVGWKSRKKAEVIQDLNDQAYFTADSMYDPQNTQLSENQKRSYEAFRVSYDSKEKEAIKRLEQETERMILDKRKLEKIGC
jgi:hypothetical protein